jgi:circadian clock protein KaiC
MVDAACRRGERCLYFAFEEAPEQIIRNMGSIGIELRPWADKGLLKFRAARPSASSLEMHLLTMMKMIEEFRPAVVLVDPLTNLISIGSMSEIKSMLVRLIDYLKMNKITALFTSLTSGGMDEINSEVGISSLMDSWLLVRNLEENGERNRGLYVLKSRGMAHSTQIREFLLTNSGVDLVNVYMGPGGILTGTARLAQESKDRLEALRRQAEIKAQQRDVDRKRKLLENRIASLQAEIENDQDVYDLALMQAEEMDKIAIEERGKLIRSRQEDSTQTEDKDR